jgi:two-component system OmpR family sensor kinase
MSSSPPIEPAASRPPRRRGPAGWSLRTRLVAAMIALLAVVCLVVGAVTEVALNRVLLNQLDNRLTASAGRSAMAFQRPPPADPRPKPDFPRGQQVGTLMAHIANGQVDSANVLGESGEAKTVPTALEAALVAVPGDGTPRTYDLGALGAYRVIAHAMPDGDAVVTGLPLAETQSTLYWVAAIEGGVTVIALLAAGIAGAVIVRRTLRPLSRVAGTASRVAELRLDRGEVTLPERVADADTDPRTEVGQVGAALNRMLGHVTAALEARHASETQVRQFVADASHELRTPLTAIRGYAELTRRGRETVPPDIAQALRRVESEAERMTVLVDDMLLLARLDAGRPLAQEPVDASILAVDAVSDVHAAGPDHEWRLDLPEEAVTVTGDPARLHQVLANLLANARTHTPPGTAVTVGVAAEGSQAVVRVIDAGPGIPAELLPHIFERFARGDTSRSRAAGSTGLGLAIVHAVVTAHHGTVEVASAPGRTAFTVRLPLAADVPSAEPADRDVAPAVQ